MTTAPTLAVIAARITEHLKRFEGDAEVNKRLNEHEPFPYWEVSARQQGSHVKVFYGAFDWKLIHKRTAISYLEWLNRGNVGKHWEMK